MRGKITASKLFGGLAIIWVLSSLSAYVVAVMTGGNNLAGLTVGVIILTVSIIIAFHKIYGFWQKRR